MNTNKIISILDKYHIRWSWFNNCFCINKDEFVKIYLIQRELKGLCNFNQEKDNTVYIMEMAKK